MSIYRPNVEKGAAFLDEHLPGWIVQVDVDGLDLGSCTECVLGQLGADYRHERRRLGMTEEDAIGYGFNVPAHENSLEEIRAYVALTEAWQVYIQEARAAGSAS